jgi:hypothetical protein
VIVKDVCALFTERTIGGGLFWLRTLLDAVQRSNRMQLPAQDVDFLA